MPYQHDKTLAILERTPRVLHTLINGLSDEWTMHNEGDQTWSVYDVMGHLIHGEKTDWVVRASIILFDEGTKTFEPFDRFAQYRDSQGKTLAQLLDEFAHLREANLEKMKQWQLTEHDFQKTGTHPALGSVSLAQLLATWAVHDLNHLAQIARVMAKQYNENVGPWSAYLKILE